MNLPSVRSERSLQGLASWGVVIGLAMTILPLAAGCQSGYHWEWMDCARAEQRAREQGKIMFVFYKSYMDTGASARMIGREVLSDPAVQAEFKDTVNVLVDRDSGPTLVAFVRKFGVNTYPACILVMPDGKRQVRTGFVPREEFLEWVRAFKAQAANVPPAKGAAPRTGAGEKTTPGRKLP